jgi:hypothetical protein
MVRALELSLFPELAPDRSVGPVLGSVIGGTNADLIAAVAPLYLTGSVCDLTYGRGGWWRRFTPSPFVGHDIDTDGVDFTALPEPDGTYDAVCFDPPYIPYGGTTARPDFANRYGIEGGRSRAELDALIAAGLTEAARVTRQWVLVKCNDYTNGRRLHAGSVKMINTATELGLPLWDLIIHHTGSGPGGNTANREPPRARRHHSYLIVFNVKGSFS